MKRKVILAVIMMMLGAQAGGSSEPVLRTAGIGVRGLYWRSSFAAVDLKVATSCWRSEVNVGGGGGSLSFYSRIDPDWLAEISMGAMGQVNTKSTRGDSEFVQVRAVTPLLFGVRHTLFSYRKQTAFQPYLAAGLGPYWFHDVSVVQVAPTYLFGGYSWEDEADSDAEVTLKSKVQPGGYLGGGIYLNLTNWCALNFDVRYHFIDFNVKDYRSGFEYGLGVNFMWGRYPVN